MNPDSHGQRVTATPWGAKSQVDFCCLKTFNRFEADVYKTCILPSPLGGATVHTETV